MSTEVLLTLGVPNKNGRVYTKEAVQKAIDSIGPIGLMGTFGMPEGTGVPLDKVAFIPSNLRIEGDTVVADIKILDTPMVYCSGRWSRPASRWLTEPPGLGTSRRKAITSWSAISSSSASVCFLQVKQHDYQDSP